MVRKQGLVPISEAFGGLSGPVKAIREASPQARHHFTQADQVNQLVSASEADPDPAQTRCRLMYIPFSRHSKAIPRSMASTRAACACRRYRLIAPWPSPPSLRPVGLSQIPAKRQDSRQRRDTTTAEVISRRIALVQIPFLPSKQENPRITYAKGGYSQTIPAPSAF